MMLSWPGHWSCQFPFLSYSPPVVLRLRRNHRHRHRDSARQLDHHLNSSSQLHLEDTLPRPTAKMRLPAMLLVAFSLVLSAVANPFPAIATENANTFDVDFMQKLSITWCFDPDHHCLAIDQEARTCTYHKDFANLKGIGMDIGIYW